MVPAFEVMTVTPAIRNMIRDNKIPQIDGTVYSANKEDMHSMDYSLNNWQNPEKLLLKVHFPMQAIRKC